MIPKSLKIHNFLYETSKIDFLGLKIQFFQYFAQLSKFELNLQNMQFLGLKNPIFPKFILHLAPPLTNFQVRLCSSRVFDQKHQIKNQKRNVFSK